MSEGSKKHRQLLEELEDLVRDVIAADSRESADARVALDELRQSETKYRTLFEDARDAIYISSRDGRILEVNRAALSLFGYPRDQMIGLDVHRLYAHPEDRHRFQEAIEEQKYVRDFELTLQRRDGTEFECLLTATVRRTSEGNVLGYQGFIRDISEHKLTQGALEKAGSQFEYLFDESPAFNLIIGLDGNIREVNKGCLEELGYEREDVVGRPATSFVAPEHVETAAACLARDFRGEKTEALEIDLIAATGARHTVLFAPGQVTIRDGDEIAAVLITGTDVTQRKVAETALRESEARYRALFEESRDVIYITSRDGQLIDISPSALSVFGYRRDEMVGRNAREFYPHPEERIEFQEQIESDGFVSDYEVTLRRKDGTDMMCRLTSSVRRDGEGDVVGYQGIIRDITQSKLAERALRDERDFISAVLETAGALVVVMDADGRIVRFNRACEEITGYASEEVLGCKVWDLFVASDETDGVREAFTILRGGEAHLEHENDWLTKSGDRRRICWSNSILKDNEGAIRYVIGTGIDVTDQRVAEQETQRVQAQLLQAQKMEAVGTLAGGIAHDFNNLLTAIQGYADLLITKVGEGDPLHRDLRQIHLAAERASNLTRQLLMFSRKQPVEMDPLDLNMTIEGLLGMIKPIIGEDIVIETDLEPELHHVRADKGSIEQVIMNLAINARDAMPQGGTLLIKTANRSIDDVAAAARADARPGEFVRLDVTDTGVGMEPETLERLFEPFFTTKGLGKGTGLGLAVVYGIVKQHGGWLDVETQVRRGTTIRVFVPVLEGDGIRKPGTSAQQTSLRGEGERILLVEDEQVVRDYAKSVLDGNGYVVFEASSADEAISVYEREGGRFALVFSDVVLPDRSGLQLLEELAVYGEAPRVLLSSGYTDDRSQWPTIREHGYPFLHKPYSVTELLRSTRSAIDSADTCEH